MATAISDTERAKVCEHLSAACSILDKYPLLHWAEDPVLRLAHFISLQHPTPAEELIAMILAIAPEDQVDRKIKNYPCEAEPVS